MHSTSQKSLVVFFAAMVGDSCEILTEPDNFPNSHEYKDTIFCKYICIVSFGTAHIVCGTGSMLWSSVCPSVHPFVCPGLPLSAGACIFIVIIVQV